MQNADANAKHTLVYDHGGASANSAFHPSGVGKLGPASAGKAKAGMVHFIRG